MSADLKMQAALEGVPESQRGRIQEAIIEVLKESALDESRRRSGESSQEDDPFFSGSSSSSMYSAPSRAVPESQMRDILIRKQKDLMLDKVKLAEERGHYEADSSKLTDQDLEKIDKAKIGGVKELVTTRHAGFGCLRIDGSLEGIIYNKFKNPHGISRNKIWEFFPESYANDPYHMINVMFVLGQSKEACVPLWVGSDPSTPESEIANRIEGFLLKLQTLRKAWDDLMARKKPYHDDVVATATRRAAGVTPHIGRGLFIFNGSVFTPKV